MARKVSSAQRSFIGALERSHSGFKAARRLCWGLRRPTYSGVCCVCSMFYVLPSPHGVSFFSVQTLRKRLSPTFVFRQCFGSHTLPYASPDEQTYDPQGLWGRATGQLLLPPFPAGCRHLVPEDRWERS